MENRDGVYSRAAYIRENTVEVIVLDLHGYYYWSYWSEKTSSWLKKKGIRFPFLRKILLLYTWKNFPLFFIIQFYNLLMYFYTCMMLFFGCVVDALTLCFVPLIVPGWDIHKRNTLCKFSMDRHHKTMLYVLRCNMTSSKCYVRPA